MSTSPLLYSLLRTLVNYRRKKFYNVGPAEKLWIRRLLESSHQQKKIQNEN